MPSGICGQRPSRKTTLTAVPALGLIGTLIGIVDLFAFGGGAIENEQVYRGLGTALFVTLTGLIYSEFLILQMKVLGRG